MADVVVAAGVGTISVSAGTLGFLFFCFFCIIGGGFCDCLRSVLDVANGSFSLLLPSDVPVERLYSFSEFGTICFDNDSESDY